MSQLILATMLLLCSCSEPPADYQLSSGAQVYEVDGASLADYRVDAATNITMGIAHDLNHRYSSESVSLSHLRIYIRPGDRFDCGSLEVSGCQVPGEIAIVAEDPNACPYQLLVHELTHYFGDEADGDPDSEHVNPELFGSAGIVVKGMAAVAGLCVYNRGWR